MPVSQLSHVVPRTGSVWTVVFGFIFRRLRFTRTAERAHIELIAAPVSQEMLGSDKPAEAAASAAGAALYGVTRVEVHRWTGTAGPDETAAE